MFPYILLFISVNIAFIVILFRLSSWYKMSRENYLFHLLCMNLTALLLILNEQIQFAADLLFVVKLFAALAIVYIPMEVFGKSLRFRIYKLIAKVSS